LAICNSYSGNTEETLSALEKIQKTGAKIVCIASGGQLINLAKENNYDFIQVPGNWASPRACLGYSIVQQICVLTKLGIISESLMDQLRAIPDFIDSEEDGIKDEAKEVAGKLLEKIPVIYIEDSMEPVALRFKQQINENSKMLSWYHVIPEMNHNELVGWKKRNDNVAVIFFRNGSDYSRNQVRLDLNEEIISNLTNTVIHLESKGLSHMERSMYFVHLGDWISFYLSQMNGVDSIEVDVIDYLKKELAKYD
jgi:glucose/mannose-6-phosphate isomerase